MANIYFTSDWHLGHENIAKHRNLRGEWENTNILFKNYTSIIHDQDIVFFLGDMFVTGKWMGAFSFLRGRKILIPGNHDLERGGELNEMLSLFEKVYFMHKYKEFWLTHCPMHPNELRGKTNIHGHTHNVNMGEGYYNVSPEVNNYAPVNIYTIRG